MMAQKQYLHELLKEAQEPFQLKSYMKNHLNLTKRKPISVETENFKQSLCKRACFFPSLASPDVTKSPAGFPSPASQKGRFLLRIPARTEALLLEAAMRIQGSNPGKIDTRIRNCGLGLFGSVLRRLKERNNNKRKAREIKNVEDERELGCNRSRLEEKYLDLEGSSSFRSDEFEGIVDSPFRFSLHSHRCPSSGHRTPEFSSPAAPPACAHETQDKENCEDEDSENAKQEEEDNKEQSSPVSVLDHPFEDDDYIPDEEDEGEEDRNPECNYSSLQRAQQELLHKLHRFEHLADLDPIELEKLMLEEDEEEEEYEEDKYKEDKEDDVSKIRKLVWGRVYNRLDLCRPEFEEWKSCRLQEAEEIAMEIEVVMIGVLVEELSQELSLLMKFWLNLQF